MIKFTSGNLLEAQTDALVNTVNTVGVMGKGIALMFKEAFPKNYEEYRSASEAGEVKTGRMFVTHRDSLFGPKWIINFPTKQHWRGNTKSEWIESGLEDLVSIIRERGIKSIAVPPLGCGNGGLQWEVVRPMIVDALGQLEDVNVLVYEPTSRYQNVAKRTGVEKLTPARALITEMVRRYSLLGIECSILEVQKLAWFLERGVGRTGSRDPLKFSFSANRYGPYSHNLTKLLDSLDGSYLRAEKRLADASPSDQIWVNQKKIEKVGVYLRSGELAQYADSLRWASDVIEGFESPLGMELLATVDWLIEREAVDPTVEAVIDALKNWSGGAEAGARKLKLFTPRLVAIALQRIVDANAMARPH